MLSVMAVAAADGYGSGLAAWPYVASVLAAYVLLCALLRYGQKRAIEAKFHFPTRASLANMSLMQTYEIQKWLGELEFPATFSTSILFALFKVRARVPFLIPQHSETDQGGYIELWYPLHLTASCDNWSDCQSSDHSNW
ncbi:hypothetical protein B0H67DRAFT_145982 [Lasiosphaeris hirsuta]|uniref:Uncharacterized protein n=1 Tax=Lasiosphaeris hirsuta TaxID=260670 RepID=A0AA40B1R8_9PEZI|nr:hypothetical protein B0H67DRAFT_145982 [Lasiosphaeris hirsuta]